MSPLAESHRGNTPPIENKAVITDNPTISAQNPPQEDTLTEIDSELPNQADSKEILTDSIALRGNPTPKPSKNTTASTPLEPKMGGTRTVGGQKQVYFLGFGCIDDNEEQNQGVYVEDMYENGN